MGAEFPLSYFDLHAAPYVFGGRRSGPHSGQLSPSPLSPRGPAAVTLHNMASLSSHQQGRRPDGSTCCVPVTHVTLTHDAVGTNTAASERSVEKNLDDPFPLQPGGSTALISKN